MTISNSEIAALFRKMADLLDIEGANPFRIRAYRQAALVIDTFPRPLADMVKNKEDLSSLQGVGKDLADKIRTIVETGRFPALEAVMERTPPVLTDLLQVPGLGPRKVEQLYETLGIETLSDLETALRDGRVTSLPGFGSKTAHNLLTELEKIKTRGPEKRLPIAKADPIAAALVQFLSGFDSETKVEMAGSFRRRKETVGDLDMVAAATNGPGLIRHFCTFPDIARVELRGVTRGTIILKSGLHVDLRVVEKQSYGTTLAYFTGARAHTIALRKLAVKNGWKLNEYGLFDSRGTRLASVREADLYKAFGMDWIPPELREMHGELEAARSHSLPRLVERTDIIGDFRVSPDNSRLLELTKAAKQMGYRWIGVARPFSGTAADSEELEQQNARIDKLNAANSALHILKSALLECPPDGVIPISAPLARGLDYLCLQVRNPAGQDSAQLGDRLIRAMDHASDMGIPVLLSQLTGRRMNAPDLFLLDLDRVATHAAKHGHFLEICEAPGQLGLSETQAQRVRTSGAGIALSSGAENAAGMRWMKYAVWQARRGWARSEDIANTRDLSGGGGLPAPRPQR